MMLGCVMCAENVEVLYDNAIGETAGRDEADAHGKFEYRRKIAAGLIHGGEYAVHAVEDDAEYDKPGIDKCSIFPMRKRAEGDEERNDDAANHLKQIEIALHRALKYEVPLSLPCDIEEFEQQVDNHDAAADACELDHHVGIDNMIIISPGKVRLHADHRRTDEEG